MDGRRRLRVPEAAERLEVRPRTVHRLLVAGLVPYRRVAPRTVQIAVEVVDRWALHWTRLLDGWRDGDLTEEQIRRWLAHGESAPKRAASI